MKIVIDIPNEEVPNKQEIIDVTLHFIDGEVCECTYPYIVLPKGHGALIDVDKIIGKIHGVRSITAVLDAPTIIETDGGDTDADSN